MRLLIDLLAWVKLASTKNAVLPDPHPSWMRPVNRMDHQYKYIRMMEKQS